MGATGVREEGGRRFLSELTMSEEDEQLEEYEDEQDDKELITWVKANSFLYNINRKNFIVIMK